MNNYIGQGRKRNQTLLVVEGNHEKNKLFWLILQTLKYQLKDWVKRAGYAEYNKTYWQYVRDLFVKIIYYNICKANCVQNGVYRIEQGNYRAVFENLDLEKILEKQNDLSDVEDGYIWVLNTCVFIVADYNFSLVKGRETLVE